jgi:hypothetical protein
MSIHFKDLFCNSLAWQALGALRDSLKYLMKARNLDKDPLMTP